MHLRGLDLNLLVALDALLTERNVTRAAERIHISQPGMSEALRKLRHHFDDRLLERIGRDLELTAKGRALADPVKTILARISKLGDRSADFDPSIQRRLFRVAATTYGCEIVAVPLLSRLREVAPLVSVEFEELATDTADRIVDGRVDFAITISARLLDRMQVHEEALRSEPLFTDGFVVAISKDCPFAGDAISADELCGMEYVETRFGGSITGVAEQLWRQQPRQPRICAWLPNFHLTLDTVGRTGMATILPALMVATHGDRYNVRALPVPFEMPVLEERLYWHRRNDSDPGHMWLQRMIETIASGIRG
ncbi:LysR family transcriptional regulator [Aureimonas leprariae]|uniref:LysR family transcriptional regulator n=1 Tax=Plantimonas leprariae TaxID=2615207 RepID=A0A7V7PSH7_9HYPH|nr:LysR family transcriptional regulator [Aureimonas leprariae]KAB0682050.1 LysR family transcriptional regulator [Aureimonas leprariae]